MELLLLANELVSKTAYSNSMFAGDGLDLHSTCVHGAVAACQRW